jgi:hypothetical protein
MTTPHIVSIRDPVTGASARILVSLGFNCFSWRPILQDGPREMLWARSIALVKKRSAARIFAPMKPFIRALA